MINLHILTVSKTSKIFFEGIGKAPIREVFREVEQSLRTVLRRKQNYGKMQFTRLWA
ncbi:MAG: hypothetical protein MUP85_23700 [Candidatus Lokiarchaeota archaeon]|nr:hypothetical protein [Candidatus Lokiarchaeota archaeon]